MADKWINAKLGEYIDSCLGKMLDKQKNRGDFHPYLGNKNVRWGNFDLDDLAEMRFEKHEHERYGLEYGDLIVCEGGEPGRCAIWRDQIPGMKIQKALHRVRTKPSLNNVYLYYWFMYAGRYGLLEPYFTGTTIKHLTGKSLSELDISIPPLNHQEKVAYLLGGLDEKIELNRQMNETLEQMAQALFKSWFVDFDPVIDNALDAGNPIPEELEARAEKRRQLRNAVAQGEASVLGMPDEIRSLFPSEFELADDMGWIPKGWKAGKLHDLLVLQRGFDLPKTKRTEGPYPLIASSGQDGVHGDFKVEGPGLVTGRSGRIGVVNFVYDNFWPLNTTLWVKEFSASSPYHGFFQLKGIDLENYATGSAVPTLNRNHVHEHPCVVAPKTILDVFDKHAETLFCRVRSNDESNQTLARIRDYLLPKLISGELQIPDAEQQIAEVMS